MGYSKCLSDMDIAKLFRRPKKRFRRAALAGHPNKIKFQDKNDKFERVISKFDIVKKAYDAIGSPDEDGSFPGRENYSKDGERCHDKREEVRFE